MCVRVGGCRCMCASDICIEVWGIEYMYIRYIILDAVLLVKNFR